MLLAALPVPEGLIDKERRDPRKNRTQGKGFKATVEYLLMARFGAGRWYARKEVTAIVPVLKAAERTEKVWRLFSGPCVGPD